MVSTVRLGPKWKGKGEGNLSFGGFAAHFSRRKNKTSGTQGTEIGMRAIFAFIPVLLR